ncbi:peptidylprolyl isomerase [Oceanibacterium hippocampi]|uniref:Parvulin-like PPIase n=1 Tax=Oceanibacterium hippocampi TaxID=745714 RepID=A0A1Y5SW42_9PROT|nr:peptidylprolyl isomerase [Oceanibacterium hippocampi]SLN48318.1 Chaperone SurA precursor [Oceanibacterium hippocampi]
MSRISLNRAGLGRLACLLLLALSLLPGRVAAQEVQRIAAVVNDEVVSAYDLAQRMKAIMVLSGITDSKENRQRVQGQALRAVIDEVIQLQEAKRVNVRVTDADIDYAIGLLETRNQIPEGRFEEFLRRRGVPPETMIRQITAEIAWSKLVQRQFSRNSSVDEEEIDSVLEKLKANAGKTEYLIAEIFLDIDPTVGEMQVAENARRLVSDIRQGASFEAIAAQFSQGPTAANGGLVGWTQPDQLDPDAANALADLGLGQITDPIRVPGGFQIYRLNDRRKILAADPMATQFTLKQLVVTLAQDAAEADVTAARTAAVKARGSITSCDDVAPLAAEIKSDSSGDLGTVRLGELPESLRDAVRDLQPGETSEPVRTPLGLHVLVVCDRKDQEVDLPSRDDIAKSLRQRRMAMLSRGYMRDLRRNATIEFR